MVFDDQGTYFDTDAQFKTTVTHVWNQRCETACGG
jgi:hypothetical protein